LALTCTRHAFTILAALSLLLCMAMCVLWIRSYFVADSFAWYGKDRIVAYNAERNVTRWIYYDDMDGDHPGWSAGTCRTPDTSRGLWQELNYFGHKPFCRAGVYVEADRTPHNRGWRNGGRWMFSLYVPQWLLAMLAVVAPAVWLRGVRRGT